MKEHVYSFVGDARRFFSRERTPPTTYIEGKLASEQNAESNIGVIGDLPTVINNFYKTRESRRDNLGSSREEDQTAIVLSCGALRGLFIAASVVALHRKGIFDYTDHIVGVSVGAACAYFGACGIPESGAEILYKHLPEMGFTSGKENVDYMKRLESIIRDKSRNAELKGKNVHVGATHRETGESIFLNLKNLSDPINGVMASILLPAFSHASFIDINGIPCVDGGYADPFPIRHAVEKLGAKNVLAISAYPLDAQDGILERIIDRMHARNLPARLKEEIKNMPQKRRDGLKYAANPPAGVNVVVLHPLAMPINPYSRDKGRLKKFYDKTLTEYEELLLKNVPAHELHKHRFGNVSPQGSGVIYSL